MPFRCDNALQQIGLAGNGIEQSPSPITSTVSASPARRNASTPHILVAHNVLLARGRNLLCVRGAQHPRSDSTGPYFNSGLSIFYLVKRIESPPKMHMLSVVALTICITQESSTPPAIRRISADSVRNLRSTPASQRHLRYRAPRKAATYPCANPSILPGGRNPCRRNGM